jgi:hypothetical protein
MVVAPLFEDVRRIDDSLGRDMLCKSGRSECTTKTFLFQTAGLSPCGAARDLTSFL